MKLYKTIQGIILKHDDCYYLVNDHWDNVVNQNGLYNYLRSILPSCKILPVREAEIILEHGILSPVGSQEVWAAGVTYLRSREARMEEAMHDGGADLYDLVYNAPRPELFFKSLPHKVAAHKQQVYIRRDSSWNVPEPELALFINANGKIEGYTIGNDMSSRSIEGENPLYLPQAKIYERSAALGPCLFVTNEPLDPATEIKMTIRRNKNIVFEESVTISMMRRSFSELVSYLFSESDFYQGCFLMTGTCIVPPNDFTLYENDEVDIAISSIGVLSNIVSHKPPRPFPG